MSVTQDHFYSSNRPQPGPCNTTLCFSFDCAGHKFNVLIMMTLMLEPVSRKTVKKRLVSGWYSGSKRWWWWCSWVWQRHVSRPIVQRLKSLQNFTHNCQSFATNWKYISFLKGEKKHELGPFLWLKIRSKTWKFWWFICFVDECGGKKVAYPLIWTWDSLWEDVKGWRA